MQNGIRFIALDARVSASGMRQYGCVEAHQEAEMEEEEE